MLQNHTVRPTYRFITPVLQHLQLPLDHRLHGDNISTSSDEGSGHSGSELLQISRRYIFAPFKNLTSSMLGIMSLSHSFRKESLSKDGSTFKISVRTSDISVLENSPPKHQSAGQRAAGHQGDSEHLLSRLRSTRRRGPSSHL